MTCEVLSHTRQPLLLSQDDFKGKAEVKQLFNISVKGAGKAKIAGCLVTEGKLQASSAYR